MKILANGYAFCWGRKMLIYSTSATKKSKTLYNAFLDKMCEIKGITDKEVHRTEANYNILKFGLIKVVVYDCETYVSVRYNNGQSNYPKTDTEELVFF